MQSKESKYRSILIQVMAWAKKCVELVNFTKAWKEGKVPTSELAARVDSADDNKLVAEVVDPSSIDAKSSFNPKEVEIQVFGKPIGVKNRKETPVDTEVLPAESSVIPTEHDSNANLDLDTDQPAVDFPVATSTTPTILVLDDYEPLLDLLCESLRKEGFQVCGAKNGIDGLVRLYDTHIDLIVSDVQMPKLDGFELSKMLNVRDVTRDIPIVFLTEVLNDKTKAIAKRLGAADILIKPFSLDAFIETIKTVIASTHHPQLVEAK